ncbi:serine/threonine-protein kinase MARK2-like isoform X2 [Amphibalanus amphitrite]|uniref:serine/threonine-protein kinase MARK2-like isoform X2 n=1 Tax=Amphibalanus amphitrite TaxID=1232801 RepID=UPI001C91D568|nr:serine/threonine-protein kinase MARK2-like isoform X2 [Amphibalanus amphitrite]
MHRGGAMRKYLPTVEFWEYLASSHPGQTKCKGKVAIKIIDVDKVKEEYVRRNLGREVKVLSRLRHPNIVRLYETMMSGHLYCLVMEYAPGGDLCSLVKAQRERRFPEGRARPFCRQLVSALTYMHGRGIIHRDLKMENIMLNSTKDVLKIVDFGLSNCWSPENPLKSHCGSPEYAAPELFVVGRTYGPEIDVWSMGVVFYVLVVGRLPFLSSKQEGLTHQERRDRLIAHINQGLGGTHRSDMKHLGSECRRLLSKVLEPQPARRLTLRHVAVHPWLTHKGLSPLAGYQHPRVSSRQHAAAVHRMSELLSIKPQLIEERVLKQMYDDIAGMYNILTNKPDISLAARLPEEARIRPVETRTPSKRPLTSSIESNSPLRPPAPASLRPAAGTPAGSTAASLRSGLSVLRSGASDARGADRRPTLRRIAHPIRPTTAPAAKTVSRTGAAPTPPTPALSVTSTTTDVTVRRPLGPALAARRRLPLSGEMRAPRVREEPSPVVPEARTRTTATAISGRSTAPPAARHDTTTPVSVSSGSERAWGSPRQRADSKTQWPDVPWDTPRRHNLTDDQKVRTDGTVGRRVGGTRPDGDVLLVSGAEDEFSSLYDDLTDDSSAADEPIRVVIRRRPTDGGGGSAAATARPELRRPRTVGLDHGDDRERITTGAGVRHIGVTRFGDEDQEAMARPIARKSPSESQRRDQPSPRALAARRRSALPIAKCTLRSPLKHASSAHAWLSGPGAVRSSGSWSSHDRLDFSGGREGRHQSSQQAAPAAAQQKAGLRESETQTGGETWRAEPADTRSQVLRYMVQREDLVPGHGVTPYSKKPSTAHRLGSAGRRATEEGSSTSADTGSVPRGKYRPQTVASDPSQLKQSRASRVLRPSVVSGEERSTGRTAAVRHRDTGMW